MSRLMVCLLQDDDLFGYPAETYHGRPPASTTARRHDDTTTRRISVSFLVPMSAANSERGGRRGVVIVVKREAQPVRPSRLTAAAPPWRHTNRAGGRDRTAKRAAPPRSCRG